MPSPSHSYADHSLDFFISKMVIVIVLLLLCCLGLLSGYVPQNHLHPGPCYQPCMSETEVRRQADLLAEFWLLKRSLRFCGACLLWLEWLCSGVMGRGQGSVVALTSKGKRAWLICIKGTDTGHRSSRINWKCLCLRKMVLRTRGLQMATIKSMFPFLDSIKIKLLPAPHSMLNSLKSPL